MKYEDLKGIKIFRPGRWHGRDYGPEDIRRIVRNSNALRPYFRAPFKLKLTHYKELQPGLLQHAAMGMAQRYYLQRDRAGNPVMCADIAHVPSVVAEAVRNHFPNVSVEKYRYLDVKGQRIPDVVKSIAFLGADAPEVKGLQNAYPGIFAEFPHGGIETFQMGGLTIMTIGEVIRAWRESLAMTPEDLAGVVGISPEELEQLETGALEPDEALLQQFADAFGIDLATLQAGPQDSGQSAVGSQQFSEADVKQMVAEAVKAAVAPLRRQIATLSTQKQQAETKLFEERKQGKLDKIADKLAFWKSGGAAGKFGLPQVCVEVGLQKFMEALEDSQTEQFAETGAAETALHCFESFMDELIEVGLVPIEEEFQELYKKSEKTSKEDQREAAVESFMEEAKSDYNVAWGLAAESDKYKHLFA